MALLTVRAAAERMGIGYSTLKQWIFQGKIRTTQTAGGHHRMSEAEIDRLLARQTPSAQTQSRATRRPTGLIVALSGRIASAASSRKCESTACSARCACGSGIRR